MKASFSPRRTFVAIASALTMKIIAHRVHYGELYHHHLPFGLQRLSELSPGIHEIHCCLPPQHLPLNPPQENDLIIC